MNFRRVSFYFLSSLLLILNLCGSADAQSEKPVVHSILIDNTGSLRSQVEQVVDLSKGIVERTYLQGPISLFVFKTQGSKNNPLAVVSSDIKWSQDRNRLHQYIDTVFVVFGQTKLMDGISAIAGELNAKASLEKDAFAGKIIFLITDGEDRSSKIQEKELIETLQDSGIKVYAVGLVKELSDEGGFIRQAPREKAVAFLKKLTKETGGRVVFPKSIKTDAGSLLNELFAK